MDRRAQYVPWGIAALFVVAAGAYLLGRGDSPAPAADPGGGAIAGASATAAATEPGAPYITNMSPRERASRLYDRIMRYSEAGMKDSTEFFAPMAMASFEMLGADLDLDARYDYGRVASETGHLDIAAAQADTILTQAPTHLLGLSLKARTAAKRGDAGATKLAWQAFLRARDAELKTSRPEYQAHLTDIQTATALAQGIK